MDYKQDLRKKMRVVLVGEKERCKSQARITKKKKNRLF